MEINGGLMKYKTKLLLADEASMLLASDLLQKDEIVALPTETVYGLAGNALCESAINSIFSAKGRPQDNPLIVHISNMDMLQDLVGVITKDTLKLADAFWPGPITLVLPKSDIIPYCVTAGLSSVAIRLPSHPVARQVIEKAGVPLAMPSANLSGSPSPTTANHVFNDLDTRIPLIIDGGECVVGLESTVVDLTTDTPVILRPGYITQPQIETVLGKKVVLSSAVLDKIQNDEKVNAPGMKYKHYAPCADITIVKGTAKQYAKYANENKADGVFALCFEEDVKNLDIPTVVYGEKLNPETQAKMLFTALRELDEQGAKRVFAHCPAVTGVSMAVYNRLVRAAEFKIVDLTCDKIKVIALTGRSGAGKSMVSNYLRKLGHTVLDCDEIAIMATEQQECVDRLVQEFGTDILKNNKVDKVVLAEKAFKNADNLKILTSITHHVIIKKLLQDISQAEKNGEKFIYVDGAVIVDELFEKYCDEFIVVLADEETQINRIIKRDGITREKAVGRLEKQVSVDRLKAIADYIICNDDITATEKQIGMVNEYLKG